ncbi:sensor histidine kinase [Gluconacetobacter takamatsuzukensis]|uniref:histidine kinase n=1 Tax=Gluconacetobacter takamatsuzukensis TaxID=1286190 RepID=A0A7W4KFA5_9PROT|nr:histidine kinase dimerization/phosphoacceptor domain -containing protein [Gluconacetobacter takamatsuzukensis]MBB2205755.1 histidine kinase [Gluconacetobacter takamatsuzukensis]
MSEPAPSTADNLTLALVAASNTPVLLLDGHLAVISASGCFCNAFGLDPAKVVGHPLVSLGQGEWNVPQLASLLAATASGRAAVDAYEMDLRRQGQETRRLVFHIRNLDYGDPGNIRLMVAVTDITDARLAERHRQAMLREKEILLQELQHRVANSLQIIASVLMQSARRVQSEESRTHLRDAHHRVMSIAALQKQLAASGDTHVELQTYFTDLCRSIGASMIQDPDEISLIVDADPDTTSADISVSLGLIVTELVINALKHAFPDQRKGTIRVGYRSGPSGWTLSVADDGIGMLPLSAKRVVGLGTNIIKALARHLDATLDIVDAAPGTRIVITHPSPTPGAPS